MPSDKKLGRGLGELLGDFEDDTSKSNIEILDTSKISINPYQPRQFFEKESINELSRSIKTHGLLQPILVIRSNNSYILVAGERRLRATKLNGEKTIKAIVLEYDLNYIRELSLIENIQREDLNAIEIAKSYNALIKDYNITHEQLAQKVKKSRSAITNSIRLLQLPDWLQSKIQSGEVKAGSAKVLVGLSEDDQKQVVDRILQNKLTSSSVEQMVKDLKTPKPSTPQPTYKISTKDAKVLQDGFLKHGITAHPKGSTITIEVKDHKSLETLMSLIKS